MATPDVGKARLVAENLVVAKAVVVMVLPLLLLMAVVMALQLLLSQG